MKEEIFTIQFIRKLIIMLVAAALFYIVCPKYQKYNCEVYAMRINTITGTVKKLSNYGKGWVEIGKD